MRITFDTHVKITLTIILQLLVSEHQCLKAQENEEILVVF